MRKAAKCLLILTVSYLASADCLLLVRHAHNSQHEVDEVEGAKEDDNDEEDDVPRTICSNYLQTFHIEHQVSAQLSLSVSSTLSIILKSVVALVDEMSGGHLLYVKSVFVLCITLISLR